MRKLTISVILAIPLLAFLFLATTAKTQIIYLEGEWKIRIGGDTPDGGAFSDTIALPGSMQAQGYGNDISADTKWIGTLKNTSWLKHSGKQPDGSFKVAGWLQPKKHYVGKAWYRRTINIPKDWKGNTVILFLERPHTTTTVYLDGKKIDSIDSLSTPHIHELGKPAPGKHGLAICVDNDLPAPVGKNAHCVTDHTQTTWNGIVGKIELRAVPDKRIDCVMAFPDAKKKNLRLKILFAGKGQGGKVQISIKPPKGCGEPKELAVAVPGEGKSEIETTVGFEKIALWDEFDPNIYKINAVLTGPKGTKQFYHTSFGFVDRKIENQQFVINGRPTLMRGTLDCASFPLTGYPSMDVKYWRRVFEVCKSMGVNHIRYHSWTPPEPAFAAADEVGIYLQCEHAWTNVGNKELQQYVEKETERVFKRFGNHPSFMMAAYGNEPGGGRKGSPWLSEWVDKARKLDGGRRFYTSAAGWGNTENSDYYDVMRGMRVYPWGAGLNSSINKNAPEFASDFSATTAKTPSKPYMGHESGQWCVYPDFDEMKLYTGFLKPENYWIFKRNLQDNKLFDRWKTFFDASGKLQTLCYKFEIEKLRRTKGCGGYQLLGINDFPGQGTALVGAVNVFWKVKSYTSPEEYRRFNGPTAILARLPKLVFAAGGKTTFPIDVSHYGKEAMDSPTLAWSVESIDGKTERSGERKLGGVPLGLSVAVKDFTLDTAGLAAPGQHRLRLSIKGTGIENAYDFWVYPKDAGKSDPKGVVVATNVAAALAALAEGRKVLLVPSPAATAQPAERKPVVGFSTIFWNTVWANRQPPTVMGVYPDPKHPLFKNFPTENHSDFQWWYILSKVENPLWLDKWRRGVKPLLGLVDDWFTCRNLALLAEAKVGKGSLLLCAIPIAEPAENNLPLNQLRDAVLEYMSSDAFAPKEEMSPEQLKALVLDIPPAIPVAKVSGEADPRYPAKNACDGNAGTLWSAPGKKSPYPHALIFELAKPAKPSVAVITQRADSKHGKPLKLEIYLGDGGKEWGKPVASATLGDGSNIVDIKAGSPAKFVKVVFTEPRKKNDKTAVIAEISFH